MHTLGKAGQRIIRLEKRVTGEPYRMDVLDYRHKLHRQPVTEPTFKIAVEGSRGLIARRNYNDIYNGNYM